MVHISPLLSLSPLQTHYGDSDYIIRQGATGDTFFIISEGQVRQKDSVWERRAQQEVKVS